MDKIHFSRLIKLSGPDKLNVPFSLISFLNGQIFSLRAEISFRKRQKKCSDADAADRLCTYFTSKGKEGERKSESRALGKERLKNDRCLSKSKQEPFLLKISL